MRRSQRSCAGWLSWFQSDDKYAREKLSGDLQAIESWYLDRGYLTFSIESTQVSISPEKDSVFITINISEGETYTVETVDFAGELKLDEEYLRPLVVLEEGMIFSQALMTASSEYITKRLGNEGYTFAEVEGYPDINEEEKSVALTLFVDPGQRTMVNRISFEGNERTHDVVLRREMRQMEKSWVSNNLLETSKLRLDRLGFFKSVKYEKNAVPGSTDEVDVIFKVEEQFSGSIGGSLGYGAYGFSLGANYSETNAFGTGNNISIGINSSDYQTNVCLLYTSPSPRDS